MPAESLKRFEKLLESGKTVPALALVGSDYYWRELCRTKVVERFVPVAAREWAVAQFSAADSGWEDIFQRAQTLPMLSACQVLILRDAEALAELDEGAAKEVVAAFEKYFADPAPFSILLIEAAQMDKRRSLFKLLEKKALVVQLDAGDAPAAELAVTIAKELGAEFDREAASLLSSLLNGEMGRMRMELEKLATYVGDRHRITAADVEALVVSARQYTVWQLADMLAMRRRDAALAFLDTLLRNGEPPPMIVGALAYRFRKLLEAQELPAGIQSFEAARLLGMYRDSAELTLSVCRKISRDTLLRGIVTLAEADSRLKSGIPDPRAMMAFLVAELTSPEKKGAAA
ncbi:MAG: DNA polymerase III subunit delta [Candidatus Acidiferrales bacterium]